jgi:hypothetical protein
VEGLVKLADRAEIEANDWSLTPAVTSAARPKKKMRTSTSRRPCARFMWNWRI